MKKISLALLAASFASAEFFGVSAGVGYQQQNISGYVKNSDTKNYFGKKDAQPPNVGYLGLDDKFNPYIWVKVYHPMPLIPNVKFQYTRYASTGHSDYVAGGVEIFGDVNIPLALTNVDTKMTISSYDLTLFYSFEPVFANFEIGGGIDLFKGKTKITGKDPLSLTTKTWVDKSWSAPLPYIYAHVDTMSIEGISVVADIKYAKLGDNHHYDYMGAIRYTFDIAGPVNPFVKAGYRYKEAYGVDGDNETKLTYKGIFLELGAQF
ncbi:MAG: TIGR04219 family outer membrane beta-barrel protein [Epsilonproteobacteria bacterium]|nr:TIGR04219 family outer membrane beta-barrel protein [Campylobacterota bacterium]